MEFFNKKKKKKNKKKGYKKHYSLENQTEDDQRIGSLVDQSEVVKIDNTEIRVDETSSNEEPSQGISVKISNRRN